MERTNGFQKAGGGNSSGLGEFWNRELAYNAALAAFDAELCALLEACTKFLRFWLCPGLDFGPNSILSSSLALSEEEEKSSSKDMLKTPSLGVRRWRDVGDGVAPAARLKGNSCAAERGAEWGPPNPSGCQVLSRVGVEGGEESSTSVVSSQTGNSGEKIPKERLCADEAVELLGAERERL